MDKHYTHRRSRSRDEIFFSEIGDHIRHTTKYRGDDQASKYTKRNVISVLSILKKSNILFCAIEAGISASDVMQAGLIGLAKAYQEKDPNQKDFWGHAANCIRWEAIEEVFYNGRSVRVPWILRERIKIEHMNGVLRKYPAVVNSSDIFKGENSLDTMFVHSY